ncbi:MAG: DPP IV N-terminal domain-containing protein [Cyclobacteriaceae bacterium]
MKKTAMLGLAFVLTIHAFAQCDTSAPGARDASWSPDGSKIIYVSKSDGNQEIFTMNANGTNQKQLTTTDYPNYYPFYSYDGAQIVFMSYVNHKTIICVMNENGSGIKHLTDTTSENGDPMFSPDGSKIVFWSDRSGNNEIYTMDRKGGNVSQITNNQSSDQTPTISPDGKRIVFISDRDGNSEIYTMNIAGKDIFRLTVDPRLDRVPRWSPDGAKIIYYSGEPSVVAGSRNAAWASAELYEVNADGTGRKLLTQNLSLDQGPVYSPDGLKVLFTSCRSGNREIFVMNVDGSDVKRLTFTK